MNPYSRLSATFLRDHGAAAARVLEDYPAESVAQLLSTASPATAQHVIENFTPGFAAACFAVLEPAEAGEVFSRLLTEFQIMVLRQLERDKRELLLDALLPDLAQSIRRRLPYPEGTAGALMEASLASVPEELSVRDALKRIKRIRRGMKLYVYVVNETGYLTGVLTLHELINAPPSRTVGEVMHRHVVTLSPSQPIQSLIDSPYWHEFYALPVTDDNNLLLGAIRHKSLHRFQDQSVQADPLSNGLGAFLAVGELFSISATHLLAGLIDSGKSLSQRDPHG